MDARIISEITLNHISLEHEIPSHVPNIHPHSIFYICFLHVSNVSHSPFLAPWLKMIWVFGFATRAGLPPCKLLNSIFKIARACFSLVWQKSMARQEISSRNPHTSLPCESSAAISMGILVSKIVARLALIFLCFSKAHDRNNNNTALSLLTAPFFLYTLPLLSRFSLPDPFKPA